ALPGTGATLAWDNSTTVTAVGALGIEYFQGGVYVYDRNARLKKVTIGTTGGQAEIHDFGGGHIVDMYATGTLLYLLYMGNDGRCSVYTYDGSTTTMLAELPSGWRYQTPHQTDLDMLGNVSSPNHVHAMAVADSVLYVSGLLPAQDYVQAQRGTTAFRQAVW